LVTFYRRMTPRSNLHSITDVILGTDIGAMGADMRVKKLILGVTVAGSAALLAACGGGAVASQNKAATSTSSSPAPTTTTTTVDPTTTTPPPPPPPATTTTTSKTTPKPTTSKPKPKPAPPPASTGTPCTITDGACIDLSANKSWLISGGKVSYGPVGITSGRPGYRTPTGNFRVQWKDIDHKSREFDDAPMPFSVFFNGGIAFHAGSLSVPSHGCIHLSTTAAKTYFNTLSVGAAVQVVP
jgi:lipoprotein-anchoring transpeptidase ErfK/SrfK